MQTPEKGTVQFIHQLHVFLPCIKCVSEFINKLSCLIYHRFGYFTPQWARISSKGMADNGFVTQGRFHINSYHSYQYYYVCVQWFVTELFSSKFLLYTTSLCNGIKWGTKMLMVVVIINYSIHIPQHIHTYHLWEQTLCL